MNESPENINTTYDTMVDGLLQWFDRNKRDLPWRHDYDPYHVWISEIMLQQTQMERGVRYFEEWMRRFPSVRAVANASEQEVMLAWEGLGYYSRARNLHRAARIIVDQYQGKIPSQVKDLEALPGIGEYTAGAIASIAFEQDVIAVDANVERVFSRIFDVAMPPKSPVAAGFIRQIAEVLLPKGQARRYTQSLMEFGALVCKKKPACEVCPLQTWCAAFRLGIVDQRPVRGKKVPVTSLQVATGILVHNGRVLVQKRLQTGVWANLWEFPGGRIEPGESPEQAVVRELFEETGFTVTHPQRLGTVSHGYTRYKIALHCFICTLKGEDKATRESKPGCGADVFQKITEGKGIDQFPEPALSAATAYAWACPEDLGSFPMPAPHRKLLDLWREDVEQACTSHSDGILRSTATG